MEAEEGIRSLGAGVTGSESSSMGAGNIPMSS